MRPHAAYSLVGVTVTGRQRASAWPVHSHRKDESPRALVRELGKAHRARSNGPKSSSTPAEDAPVDKPDDLR